MIHSVEAILNAHLQATDGKVGRCADFLFDDKLLDPSLHGGRHA